MSLADKEPASFLPCEAQLLPLSTAQGWPTGKLMPAVVGRIVPHNFCREVPAWGSVGAVTQGTANEVPVL